MRISYSDIQMFKHCPQCYKLKAVDKIKQSPPKVALFGTAVHNALFYMFSKDPLYPSFDEIVTFFRKNIEDLFSNRATVDEKNRYLESGITMLKKFYKDSPPWNFITAGLETFCYIPLIDPKTSETHTITGKIDRIDKTASGIEIIDYKTSRSLPSQQYIDTDLQMSIYLMSVLHKWPHIKIENTKLSLYFLRHGEKLTTTRTSEALTETTNEILEITRTINSMTQTNEWPVSTTSFCSYCPLCPAWKHLYSQSPTDEEIKEIVDEYITLDSQNKINSKRLKHLKTSIMSYLNTNSVEGVFADKGYIQRSDMKRHSWNLEKVREILEPAGLWESIQGPDEKKLTSLLKELPADILEQLRATRTVKISSVLRVKKDLPSSAEEYKEMV